MLLFFTMRSYFLYRTFHTIEITQKSIFDAQAMLWKKDSHTSIVILTIFFYFVCITKSIASYFVCI